MTLLAVFLAQLLVAIILFLIEVLLPPDKPNLLSLLAPSRGLLRRLYRHSSSLLYQRPSLFQRKASGEGSSASS
ncbi:hypothetical protein AGABI1DRAFT_134501 [Agaricus bisporus var. burnettii JB137-S8]|uniref:Uncharacterized protein n=1 Tax=Agaricus bisporus var. burnettii (strain JB137-S8 / ATCC MYA-4627 / FGSC 10392) TaxID=597362 RepID=K5VGZ6_AGABU|nr:uncharacterized protein AGABI1DRAFT_134501 [Agaricus bisporus var. burnettii JB137-S8]EKM73569.1 hypothetical protein AGABI1DRAFT_134501 [Agaricus bisporus var. burnettii JB137-S8]